MKIFIQTAADGYDLIQKLLRSKNREAIENILVEAVKECLKERIRRKAPDMPLNYADAEMEIEFYAAGITAVLLKYCGEKDLDVDQLSARLCRFLSNNRPDGV